MPESLVVVGAGGFGREVVDVIRAINAQAATPPWSLVGVVDDHPSAANLNRLAALSVEYLGPVSSLASGYDGNVAIGVGAPGIRRSIAAVLERWAISVPVLVHPAAVVGSEVRIAVGTVICANASVGSNVVLGRHTHLNAHSVVGHDSILEDFVSVNPNATISGGCVVRRGALIGAGSVILQELVIGHEAVVAASACVVSSVEPRVIVRGVPAARMM